MSQVSLDMVLLAPSRLSHLPWMCERIGILVGGTNSCGPELVCQHAQGSPRHRSCSASRGTIEWIARVPASHWLSHLWFHSIPRSKHVKHSAVAGKNQESFGMFGGDVQTGPRCTIEAKHESSPVFFEKGDHANLHDSAAPIQGVTRR